jgi:hypothetical protein
VRRVRLAALVAVVAALTTLASCGGGNGGSGNTKADPAADKTTAEKIVLKQSDFPSGWTSKPHQTAADDTATKARFDACIGAPDPRTQQTADAHSPDFIQGQVNSTSSEALMVNNESVAADVLAALQGPKTVDCVKTLVQEAAQKQLPGGAPAANVAAEQLKFPTLKDGTAAVRTSFTFETGGVNVLIYADIVYFKSGRALVSLSTVNAGTPMDSKVEESLAQKMAARA